MQIFSFVFDHWAAMLAVFASGWIFAKDIVGITPWKQDDEILAKAEELLTRFGWKPPTRPTL